jgi:hypothetical protein
MPFSVRLDFQTEAKIRRLTVATGRSKSAVVRDAVAQYAPDRGALAAHGESAFDRLTPFIGIIKTGGANYSKHTHVKYRALLKRKHRARRAR